MTAPLNNFPDAPGPQLHGSKIEVIYAVFCQINKLTVEVDVHRVETEASGHYAHTFHNPWCLFPLKIGKKTAERPGVASIARHPGEFVHRFILCPQDDGGNG